MERGPARTVIRVSLCLAGALWVVAAAAVSGQMPPHPSLIRTHPAIDYASAPTHDAVARLNQQLEAGTATLAFDESNGYLRSVLKAFDISPDSQLLVFSKTSFQAPKINPRNPRAVFFNDHVSIGWVRGGEVLEVVAQDPRQGARFYTLKETQTAAPRFERNDACLTCHISDGTEFVPGMFVGSVFPRPDGMTSYGPSYTTDDRSPFDTRWGGWYVTGTHQGMRHLGNAVVTDPANLEAMVTPATTDVVSLDGRFDPTGYPSAGSDVVGFLVLEHQTGMLNLITRLGWETRVGKDSVGGVDAWAEALVDYMLFVDEVPLPGPVKGTSTFAAGFSARGPRDRHGRSLRDFDLERRIFKYPCSYVIYAESFDAMPDQAKAAVYARLWRILSGAETAPKYARLTTGDRRAILEILRDTKKGVPDYFSAGV